MDPLTLIGAIPTALNTVQSLTSLFDQPYMPPKQYQENSREVFKKGGKIRGHNKYNAPQHSQGGQLVNNQGIPDPNGTNEIEGTESKYTYTRLSKKNPTYIFTPEDSEKVSKLTKKYSNANTSDLEKNALELSIQRIENNNEMKKKKQEIKEYKYGGGIKKYMTGGPINPYPLVGVGAGLQNIGSLLNPYSQAPTDYMSNRGNVIKSNPAVSNNLSVGPGKDYQITQPLPRNKDLNFTFDGNTIEKKDYFNQEFKTTPTASTTDSKTSGSTSNPLKTLDTLRNLTLAGSSLGLLKRAEREDPIMTDYSKARGELNKLESNLDPMREQYAQSSNQLRAVNRNSASSYNSFANREAQRVANLQQGLAGVTLQEQQQRNNIASQKAQFESGVAQDNKQTLQQNRINNQMNESGVEGANERQLQTIMNDLDRRSMRENNKNLSEATTTETMALMANMFPDFDASDPFYAALIKRSTGQNLTEEEKTVLASKEAINFKTR